LPCARPRRRPHDKGTNKPRAPTPGTGVAPSPRKRGRPGRSAAPSTHRCEPSQPLQGGALVSNQRPPKRDDSLPRVPAVPVPSARSQFAGRRQRRRCPLVAQPNAIASTTPLIGRCQRLSRRCRRRAVIAVGFEVHAGRRRYRSGLSCVLRSPHYLLPLSLALRDTSRVLSCPVLVTT